MVVAFKTNRNFFISFFLGFIFLLVGVGSDRHLKIGAEAKC